jgi:hypothetical protein
VLSYFLGGIRLPDIYETLYSQHQRSGRVSLTALNNILSKGKITANQTERVKHNR